MNNNCLKVGIAVIGVLLVIATITSLISHCSQGKVTFESPASGMIEVTCGAREILCNYSINDDNLTTRGIPHWSINTTIYSARSLDIPPGFDIRDKTLVVMNRPGVNNTHFFCVLQLINKDHSNPHRSCSPTGHVIIKKCVAPRIMECMPVYSLMSDGRLQRINTTLNLTKLKADDIAPAYSIIYSNSLGIVCDSTIINPASNCTGGICSYMSEVPSWCSNASNVSVVVSTTDSNERVNGWESETMIIDCVNRLVSVSVNIEESSIKCIFLDHLLLNTLRLCFVKHGPASSDCGTNPAELEKQSETTSSKSITFNEVNFSYISTNTELCISLKAKIAGKEWIQVRGTYTVISGTTETESLGSDESDPFFLVLAVSLLFLIVILIIVIAIVVCLVRH